MPIFEYVCNVCQGRKFSALVGVVASAPPPTCPKCGGNNLTKVVSRFARVRSEDEAIDAIADQADNTDFDDTGAVRRLMRDMASEMGEDMGADDFAQIMDEAENDLNTPGGANEEL